MQELTNFGNLAYMKVDELEHKLGMIDSKVKQLEILYGSTPPAPDPNDTEDEEYIVPSPGEILTTGDIATVPVYYETKLTTTFPYLYFTADASTTIILKLNLEFMIKDSPVDVTIELYVDDVLFDSYSLINPVVATYNIPFANSYISTQVGHKIHYKVVPSTNSVMTYKVVTAKYEILGYNIDFLNAPKIHTVHYNDGIYYLSKCMQGYSNHLIQSISGLNLNASYTQHVEGAIEQKFCHSYQRINDVWQPTYLGHIYKLGSGISYIVNYNDPTKKVTLSYAYGFDYIPNQNTYYGGVIIFCGGIDALYYYDVVPDFSSRTTRTIDSADYYVNVAGVKMLFDNFNTYPQKAKCVATRLNGTNVFFSAVSNYYKVELGYGTNVSACYANEEGTIIHVFMKVYNQIVLKVLTYNTTTSKYELTSQTSIGTWNEYIKGAPLAYFTITNNILSYNPS